MNLARAYGLALHLYPRSFRREYGADMVALLDEQLRDDGVPRVLGRAVTDLIVTVPARHLEAHLSRTSTAPVVVAFAALAVILVVAGGPGAVIGALASAAAAVLTWSRSRPVVATGDSKWRKLLLAGATLLVSFLVVVNVAELPNEAAWGIAMFVLVTSVVLVIAGLVLGVSSRFRST